MHSKIASHKFLFTSEFITLPNVLYALQTLLSVPRVHTTFDSRGFSVAVWNSLPFGICHSSSTHTFCHHLKADAAGSVHPSSSPKCPRFGHWLTLSTLIHLLLLPLHSMVIFTNLSYPTHLFHKSFPPYAFWFLLDCFHEF